MDTRTLDSLKTWFNQYVAAFYTGGQDQYLDDHYALKEKHTGLVCEIARWIAGQIGLKANDVNLAEATALLHDVGRFEQFKQYRTYKDPESVNHCLLGLDILQRKDVLKGLDADERRIIEKTVEYHGMKELPDGLDPRTEQFCGLIRDADKVDIFRVLAENFRRYHADPQNFPLEVEFSGEPVYSEEVIANLRQRKPIDYRYLKTLLDAKLLTLGWIYDINFPATLALIRQAGHWEELMRFLPDIGELPEIKESMKRYLDEKSK